MSHEVAADVGCLVGAAGAAGLLLAARRAILLPAALLLAAGEVLLAYSAVPSDDLDRLAGSGLRIAAIVVVVAVLAAGGLVLARFPHAAPVALLLTAPFRVPVHLGDQKAFLLLPLYAVLASAGLALLLRAWRERGTVALPRLLSVPASAFLAVSAVSLLWTHDLRAGTIELLFFLFPFALLVAVVARTPLAGWLSRWLATVLVALACGLAGVGLSQLWTGELYFARDLEVANAYTTYFRTTSLFADSSIYGRELALAIVVVLVALWLGRVGLLASCVLLAFLGTALYFTYSQSSMVGLAAAALLVGLVAGGRTQRRVLVAAALALVLVAGLATGLSARGKSAQKFTSGRANLVRDTWNVFVDHPLVGVGVGSQPAAARAEGGKRKKARNASHTTPLTVAAELGALGLLAYLALLLAAARLLREALWRERALGLALAGCFFLLFVHSLVYAGFFEDPVTWGALALAAAAIAAERAARSLGPRPPTGSPDQPRVGRQRRARS